jgi:hypothetical protein
MAYGALDHGSGSKGIPRVHAVGVFDSPDYFYKFVGSIADEMGATHDFASRQGSRICR